MKKKVLALVMALIVCLALAGCGGDKKDKQNEESGNAEVTSIAGNWECTDITIEDNGQKLGKEDIRNLYGDDFSELMKLTAYGDGTGELKFMEVSTSVTWTEQDGAYTLTLPQEQVADGAGVPETMTARIKENKLQVTSKESYTADEKEQTMTMTFTLKYLGRESKILDGWDVQLSDEEVYAMSNFMNFGACVVADGMLYGDYGGKEWGEGTFSVAKLDGEKVKDRKVIAKDSKTWYLSEYDGNIYGILNCDKIIKAAAGKSTAKTLYEGTCQYLQVTKDGIFFTDENHKYCRMDLDGKNKETVLDKAVYFPYQVGNGFLVYQDDGDGESLHMYNLKSKKDVKLNSTVSYNPMICGDYLYYQIPTNDEDKYFMGRIDLYSGEVKQSEKADLMYAFFVEPDFISVACDGFLNLKFDEWDKQSEKSFGGYKYCPVYSNGEVYISKSFGEDFISTKEFRGDNKQSIGFAYNTEEE